MEEVGVVGGVVVIPITVKSRRPDVTEEIARRKRSLVIPKAKPKRTPIVVEATKMFGQCGVRSKLAVEKPTERNKMAISHEKVEEKLGEEMDEVTEGDPNENHENGATDDNGVIEVRIRSEISGEAREIVMARAPEAKRAG